MRFWMGIATLLAVYLLIMKFNPARAPLRDGFQCLRRYPAIWAILTFFYATDAAYHVTLQWLATHASAPALFRWKWQWLASTPESVAAVRSGSWLPALDHVGDLFLVCFPPFPMAALGAFLFVFANWLRLHETLIHLLRRRQRVGEWVLYALLLASAMAAIIKPLALYAGVSTLQQYIPGLLLIQTSALIDWLAYLFGAAFGVAVQLYLIHAIAQWIHGSLFKHREVMAATLPQAVPVLKWAGIIAMVKTGLVILPQLLCHTPPFSGWIHPTTVEKIIAQVIQPGMSLLLLAAASFQINLAFQSKTLKGALRDHYRFLRQHRWETLWFLFIATLHFYFAELIYTLVATGLQKSGAFAHLWRGVYSIVWAFLSGWLLASWVCLFRRSTPRMTEEDDDDPHNLETLRRETLERSNLRI